MNEKLISVIVPVYNGRKHITNIFKSIDRQTYRRLEVLFIDDSSEDDSVKTVRTQILERAGNNSINLEGGYRSRNGIIYRLISTTHKGQGGVRNLGVDEAKGEYVVFIDQDDLIKRDYISNLYEIAERDESDLVISGYEHIDRTGKLIERVKLTNADWCRFMNITPWGKIYRRKFLLENSIRFFPTPLGEDVYFNIRCYSCCKKLSYTDYIGYRWVFNEESLSNTLHRTVTENVNVVKLLKMLLEMEGSDAWIEDPQYEYFFLKTGLYHIFFVAGQTRGSALIKYKRAVFDWLKDNMAGSLNNNLIGLNSPIGERFWVRGIVWLFMILYRLHLDEVFLLAIHFIQSITNRCLFRGSK